jgi:hypothetical protein
MLSHLSMVPGNRYGIWKVILRFWSDHSGMIFFDLPTAQDSWDCWADFSGLVQDHDGITCGLQKCGIAGIAPWLTQQPPSFFCRVQPQVRRLYMNRVWDVEFARSDHGTTRRWLETSVPRIPKMLGRGWGLTPSKILGFQTFWGVHMFYHSSYMGW